MVGGGEGFSVKGVEVDRRAGARDIWGVSSGYQPLGGVNDGRGSLGGIETCQGASRRSVKSLRRVKSSGESLGVSVIWGEVPRWGGRVVGPGRGEGEVIVGGRKGGGQRREPCQFCQGCSWREGEPCWDCGEEGLDDVVVGLSEGEVVAAMVWGATTLVRMLPWISHSNTHEEVQI